MEIVSESRQRSRFVRGIVNATQRITLDADRAEALGLDPAGRYDKRQIGLAASPKSWSAGIERAHNNTRYRDAMDEATERFTPPGADTWTNMWEQGLLKSSQEDWIQAIVNRGISKYNEAMDPEFAYAHFRSAAPDIANWLENITMANKIRSPSFDVEDEITHNIERVRAVALGLNAQARGQDLPAAATGNPVALQAPEPEAIAASYVRAFENFGAEVEYGERFTNGDGIPQWYNKALDKVTTWDDLDDELNVMQRNWFQRANAVMEEDFMAEALSERARNNYENAFAGDNQAMAADAYMDGYAPYREALVAFNLDEAQPRGPRGTDANILRASHVAGLMRNTKYIFYGLAGTGEFTPYGAGTIEQMSGWISDIADEWSPF